jgi:hypothetical protein
MAERARYRREIKIRVDDVLGEGIQAYKTLNGIASDSEAVTRIARLFLFGTVGSLPANLLAVSAEVAKAGITEDT